MHHGGAGTTGASLGAGLPTIIKPFFGDQYFWYVPTMIASHSLHWNSANSGSCAPADIAGRYA